MGLEPLFCPHSGFNKVRDWDSLREPGLLGLLGRRVTGTLTAILILYESRDQPNF